MITHTMIRIGSGTKLKCVQIQSKKSWVQTLKIRFPALSRLPKIRTKRSEGSTMRTPLADRLRKVLRLVTEMLTRAKPSQRSRPGAIASAEACAINRCQNEDRLVK